MAPEAQFCTTCGKPRREGARFCYTCGTTFDAPEVQPSQKDTPAVATTAPTATATAPVITQAPPPAPMPAPPSAAPAGEPPKEVKSAGRILIAMGILTVLAGLFLLAMYASGELQDRYDVADWFPIAVLLSAAIGGLAIVSGVGVLRLNPTWRIVGMVVSVVAIIGMLINLLSGVLLSLLLLFFWGRALIGLAKSGDAFLRTTPR